MAFGPLCGDGTLTDDTAGLYPVLVYLHQVVGQVAELWLHALWKQQTQVNKKTERLPDGDRHYCGAAVGSHPDIEQVGECVHVLNAKGILLPQLIEQSQSLVNI